jgi:lipid A 3-O-deacylase
MMNGLQRALVLLPLSALAVMPAAAQSVGQTFAHAKSAWHTGEPVYGVEIDNDSLLLQDRDGFYSSGARLTGSYRLRTAERLSTSGWRIGQELYTPSDIKLPPEQVGPPDRPYAGWIYAGLFYRTDNADGRHTELGIDVGCIGPCAGGEWTQNRLHSVLDDPRPQAWSRQVGQELGIVLTARHAPVRWKPVAWLDVTPAAHVRAGNIFTDAGGQITVRAGQLNRLPHEPTFNIFLRADGRIVGYNATLQGRLFSSDVHTVKPKRAVGEAEAGVSWNRMPFEASFSVVRRSNEIKGLPSSFGAQNFARLQVRYAFQ